MIWLKLVAAIAVGSSAFTLTAFVVAKLLSVYVTDVVVFFGPRPLRMRIGNVNVSIGIIPTGGGVEFAPGLFEVIPIWKKLVFAITGPLSLFFVSIAFVGLSAGVQAFVAGFRQVLSPLVSFNEPHFVLTNLMAFMNSASLVSIIGFAAAKQAAASCIPFPANPCGSLVVASLKRISDQVERYYLVVGTLILSALAVGWAIALLGFVRST